MANGEGRPQPPIDDPKWIEISQATIRRVDDDRYAVEAPEWSGWMIRYETGVGSFSDALAELVLPGPLRVLVQDDHLIGVAYRNVRIHPITIRIMEALEIDVAAAWAWATSALTWRSGPYGKVDLADGAVDHHLDNEVVLTVGYDGWMLAKGELHVAVAMPETVANALAGRRLNDVVRIPDIEACDLEILGAETNGDWTKFHILPDTGQITL